MASRLRARIPLERMALTSVLAPRRIRPEGRRESVPGGSIAASLLQTPSTRTRRSAAGFFAFSLTKCRSGLVPYYGPANVQSVADAVISSHDEYRQLGRIEPERQAAYRELLRYQLDPGVIDELREATSHELVVGTSRFKDEIEAMTKRRMRLGRPSRPRKETDGEY